MAKTKYVYFFGGGKADGTIKLKPLLGADGLPEGALPGFDNGPPPTEPTPPRAPRAGRG